MSFFESDAWKWLKAAPLPVVLAICLTCFTALAVYARQQEQAVIQTQARTAALEEADRASMADRSKINERLDEVLRLTRETLIVVTEVRTKVDMHIATTDDKKKKE